MHKKSLTVIAGGSKGLGAALVAAFSQEQHRVIEFSRSGTGDTHIDCDFSQTDSATQVFQNTFSDLSNQSYVHINLIVNTAVLAPFGSLQDTNQQAIETHLDINVNSTMMLLHAFIKFFQNHSAKKTISYISSGAAQRDIPGLAMYSASKAFFERFIKTTAIEQQTCEYPIKCMVINPGVMNTDMQAEIRTQSPNDFPMVNLWQDWHRKGQLAAPEDIARICYGLIDNSGENGGYYVAQEYLKN